MNTNATLEQMKELRLSGMVHAYRQQLELPLHQQLEAHHLIAHLVQTEQLSRSQEKTTYYLKLAKLRLPAIPEQVNCSGARNLTKEQLATLLEGHYLDQGENVLVTGATGCGKSYLACALGHQSCLQGRKTTYFSMNRFIEKITLSKLDGSYLKLLNHLERQALIILDDFGLQPMQQDVKLALLQVLEERHGRKATLVTSQLPVGSWHEYINEPTIADAILDRLTAGAHRIELKGESLRRKTKAK
jgi:DNA replication protein DnaC